MNLIIVLLLITSIILPPWFLWWLSQRSCFSRHLNNLGTIRESFVGVMGMLFTLNLVFVCNEIWQDREKAKAALSREGESMRNIGRIASNIPDGGGKSILSAGINYLEQVITKDFSGAQTPTPNNQPALSSLPAVIVLSDAILNPATLQKLNPAAQQLLVTQLTIVRDKRLERTLLKNITPNLVKWISLLFLELMALVSIAIIHVNNGRALVVTCLIFLTSVNPFLLALYYSQSPFSGIEPISKVALVEALDRLKSMELHYLSK